ncbi:hypothetical protein EAI_16688, partial [Harpegnathos saltator]
EIWLKDSDSLNIANYRLVTHNRSTTGGGSAIACRSDINFTLINIEALNHICTKYHIDCCVIRFISNNTLIMLASLYNPPNNNLSTVGSNISAWEDIFHCFDNFDNVIITEDFN